METVPTLAPLEGASPHLADLRTILFDMDGVLYVGDAPLPGVQATFDYLDATGRRYCLITNNSTMTPHQYAEKLARMDVTVAEAAILTAGVATALYLAAIEPDGAPVYIIGERGLREPLEAHGFWLEDRAPRYVCVGLDRGLTYEKLKLATLAIRAGARFIASNPDTTLPTEEGLVPGNGAALAAIRTATDVEPFVVGKPSAEIVDLAVAMLCAEKATTAIIGDRLDTDVLAGQRAGIGRILILTGVHQPADIPAFEGKPNWVVSDLSELCRLLDGGTPAPLEASEPR
jgi:4-nitrophenyl phosphatase